MAAQPVPQLELTPDELRELADIAQRRGFSNPTDYVREIIKADIEDDTDIDPEESFRLAWEDVRAGRVMSREEFRRRMASFAFLK